ncbi:MAG: hypothetical protein ACRCZP_20690, partial [Phycicoccus sp.]
GLAAGHVMVALVAARANPTTVSTPAGWVKRAETGDDAEAHIAVYTRAWQSGDTGPTFSTVDQGMYCVVGRVTGASTTTPVDVTATTAFSTLTAMSIPQVTTVTAACEALAFFFTSNDVDLSAPTNGGALVLEILPDTNGGIGVVTKTLGAAGATGAFGLTQATSVRQNWAGALLALRPSSGPVDLAGVSSAVAAQAGALARAQRYTGTSAAVGAMVGQLLTDEVLLDAVCAAVAELEATLNVSSPPPPPEDPYPPRGLGWRPRPPTLYRRPQVVYTEAA